MKDFWYSKDSPSFSGVKMNERSGSATWYAVFFRGVLLELTQSSEDAVKVFLSEHNDGKEGGGAYITNDGMYKVTSLRELADLMKKGKGK